MHYTRVTDGRPKRAHHVPLQLRGGRRRRPGEWQWAAACSHPRHTRPRSHGAPAALSATGGSTARHQLRQATLTITGVDRARPRGRFRPASRPAYNCMPHVGPDHGIRYFASVRDCRACVLKSKCCPNMPARRIVRDVNEHARDVARALAGTEAFDRSRRNRKRIEMLFAHLKRILRLGRLRLRGPYGAQDEFTLGAIAQNLRRLAMLVARPPPKANTCLT